MGHEFNNKNVDKTCDSMQMYPVQAIKGSKGHESIDLHRSKFIIQCIQTQFQTGYIQAHIFS